MPRHRMVSSSLPWPDPQQQLPQLSGGDDHDRESRVGSSVASLGKIHETASLGGPSELGVSQRLARVTIDGHPRMVEHPYEETNNQHLKIDDDYGCRPPRTMRGTRRFEGRGEPLGAQSSRRCCKIAAPTPTNKTPPRRKPLDRRSRSTVIDPVFPEWGQAVAAWSARPRRRSQLRSENDQRADPVDRIVPRIASPKILTAPSEYAKASSRPIRPGLKPGMKRKQRGLCISKNLRIPPYHHRTHLDEERGCGRRV